MSMRMESKKFIFSNAIILILAAFLLTTHSFAENFSEYAENMKTGNEFFQKREYKKALPYFRKATKTAPQRIAPYIASGVTSQRLGKSTQAITYLENGLNIDPDNRVIFFELGKTYYQGPKDIDKALYYLERAFQMNPDDLRVQDLLSEIYYQQKDFENAKKYMSLSVPLLEEMGEYEKANKLRHRIKQLN